MTDKEKRPAEKEAPTGTVQITLPDYNMFTLEEQEKAKELMQLMWIALNVNGLNNRDNDSHPENHLPAIFADYSGHVSILEFRCYVNGYRRDCDLRNYDEYQNREIKIDERKERFFSNADSIKRWLNGFLEGMKHDRI